jgi:hypothetical protein
MSILKVARLCNVALATMVITSSVLFCALFIFYIPDEAKT